MNTWYQRDAADTIPEATVEGRHGPAPRSVTFGGDQRCAIVAVDLQVVAVGTFLNATTLVRWRATRA